MELVEPAEILASLLYYLPPIMRLCCLLTCTTPLGSLLSLLASNYLAGFDFGVDLSGLTASVAAVDGADLTSMVCSYTVDLFSAPLLTSS